MPGPPNIDIRDISFKLSEKEHTVYEAEAVGVAMALHLLKNRNRQITRPLSICSTAKRSSRPWITNAHTPVTTFWTRYMTSRKNYIPNRMVYLTESNVRKQYQTGAYGKGELTE
jgi:hypothetical protein